MMAAGHAIAVKGRLLRVGRLDAEKYVFLDDPGPTLRAIREHRGRVDVFTFLQPAAEPIARHPFRMESDNFAVLPVSTFDHWWTNQLNNKTRNMVRRADKAGIVTREVPFDRELAKGIWTIYNESEFRQGKPFAHFGKDLDTVERMSATYLDRSVFIGAFAGDTLVGFAKLVIDHARSQAGLMHIVSMIGQRDKAPTNALIAGAVRACAERSIPRLVYSNFAYGKKERDSLADFKTHNGFVRVDVPRYYVPLTLLGASALRLQLHKGMRDRLPEAVLAEARRIRALWRQRRQTPAVRVS